MRLCKLFVDTMIFLHYRPLRELDLPALVGAEEVVLVVPRVTLRELDKHKSTHSSRKIRDRARKVLAEIEASMLGALPQDGLKIEFISMDIAEEVAKQNLDVNWSDDLFVAAALLHKQSLCQRDEGVVVLTQDTGPRIMCRQLGIPTMCLDESMRLPEELNELEQQVKQLSAEVQRLKNAMPRLALVFADGDGSNTNKFSLQPPKRLDESELNQKLADVKSEYPDSATLKSRDARADLIGARAISVFGNIPEEEYTRYDRERARFISRYEGYLRELHTANEILSRMIAFKIDVCNTGTAPAEDVHMRLHFPDGFKLYDDESPPNQPSVPAPPDFPQSRHARLMSGMSLSNNYFRPQFPQFKSPKPFNIKKTNSYEVTDHFSRIKHGVPNSLPEMYAEFPSFEQATSFNCDYELRAANITDAVRGTLNFVVVKPRS